MYPGNSRPSAQTAQPGSGRSRTHSGHRLRRAAWDDAEIGIASQQYMPDELRGRRYYEPKALGAERDVQARLEKIRRILDGG